MSALYKCKKCGEEYRWQDKCKCERSPVERGAMPFRVGNRVKILREDCAAPGKLGFIVSIDGEYYYVRPRWCKWDMELYRHEIEKA